MLGTVLADVACVGATQAQMQTSEVQIKAASIYSFALFTNWSTGVMQADVLMVVCVAAQHPLQAVLEKLAGRPVRGHRLEIRKINGGTVAGCHVLVFDTRVSNGICVDLATLVPTMSDSPKNARAPGTLELMITLMLYGDHVVFDIGAMAARQIRLQISSQLPRLVRGVR